MTGHLYFFHNFVLVHYINDDAVAIKVCVIINEQFK